MPENTDFSARIARIHAQRPPAPDAGKPRKPAPLPRGMKPSGGPSGAAALGKIAFGLGGMCLLLAMTWGMMGSPSHNALSPKAALEHGRKDNIAFNRCVNDPKRLANLKKQGHADPKFAAMLMCS